MAADWKKIKAVYITGDESYRALAARFGVPLRTLSDRAKRERWVALRAKHRDKIVTKACRAAEKNEGQKLARLCCVADRLTGILVLDSSGRPVRDKNGRTRMRETVDAREFRALVAATRDMVEIVRNVYEIPMQGQTAQTVEVKLEGDAHEFAE